MFESNSRLIFTIYASILLQFDIRHTFNTLHSADSGEGARGEQGAAPVQMIGLSR
jgi:hypothetical protein